MVPERAPIPAAAFVLDGVGVIPLKVGLLIVMTATAFENEQLAVELVRRALLRGLVTGVDTAFLAGLLASVTPTASTANDPADIWDEVRALLAAVVSTGDENGMRVVMSVETAVNLATRHDSGGVRTFGGMRYNGGELAGVPVLVTRHLPVDSNGHTVLAVSASQIAFTEEPPNVEVSRVADVRMADDPTMPTQMTSLFQTDSVGILVSRRFGWEVLEDATVGALTGVMW